MAGSSGMEFARVARRRGYVSRRQMARWGLDHLRYRLQGATDQQTDEVVRVAKETLANMSPKAVSRMWPEVLSGILPRLYPEMVAEIHRHQDEGRQTYIVSAAGHEMVEALATVLGMDGGIGTRYLSAQGAYTGELEGPFVYGEGKVIEMRRVAEERGIDLEDSWSYSDSASDLPMLRAVGNPVVVNPDAALLEVARAEGWRVMRFERLGRNLLVGMTVALALVLGGLSRAASSRSGHRPARVGRR